MRGKRCLGLRKSRHGQKLTTCFRREQYRRCAAYIVVTVNNTVILLSITLFIRCSTTLPKQQQ